MTPATFCRSCNAEVVWLVHERTGKRAPIDAAPADGGNVAVDLEAGTYRIVRKRDELAAGGLHTNHFATCEQAARWRS